MARVIELEDKFKILIKNTAVEVMTISGYNKSRGMNSNSSYISTKDCIGKVKVKQAMDDRLQSMKLVVVDKKYSYLDTTVEKLQIVHEGKVFDVMHEKAYAKQEGVSRQRISFIVNNEDKLDVIKFPHGKRKKNLIVIKESQYEPKNAELVVAVI